MGSFCSAKQWGGGVQCGVALGFGRQGFTVGSETETEPLLVLVAVIDSACIGQGEAPAR